MTPTSTTTTAAATDVLVEHIESVRQKKIGTPDCDPIENVPFSDAAAVVVELAAFVVTDRAALSRRVGRLKLRRSRFLIPQVGLCPRCLAAHQVRREPQRR